MKSIFFGTALLIIICSHPSSVSTHSQLTNVSFAGEVDLVHHLQQLDLNDGLVVERLLVLNDLDGNVLLVNTVKCLDYLLTSAIIVTEHNDCIHTTQYAN